VKPLAAPTSDERAEARAEFGLVDGEIAGAWIASLDTHKDPLTPIRAVQVAHDRGARIALLVAGDGPLRPDVERVAREHAVRVLGYRRDVQRVLSAADFFVLSSRREGLSLSLLEAMSLALPSVVSDEAANAEAVGDTGIVVGYGDVDAFAAAFVRLAADQSERASLGSRARERVERRFSADEMVAATRNVYDDVLSVRTRSAGV
jgi:glycosyltransferase involved in cell wall biosynthesis